MNRPSHAHTTNNKTPHFVRIPGWLARARTYYLVVMKGDCKQIIELFKRGLEFRPFDLLILNQINPLFGAIYLMTIPVTGSSEKVPLTVVRLLEFSMLLGHLSRRCARALGKAGADCSKRILCHKTFKNFYKKKNHSECR